MICTSNYNEDSAMHNSNVVIYIDSIRCDSRKRLERRYHGLRGEM